MNKVYHFKTENFFLIYTLSHLRTKLTVSYNIFDGKKLLKRYVSAKMSIKRSWKYNKMDSNLHMPYEYVETKVCEPMALSVATVCLKLVYWDGERYLRLEFVRKNAERNLHILIH
jgi:hypothetical protein